MVRLPSHEVQHHWTRVQDMVLVEPVTITSNGCDRMVVMSADEYHRLKRRDRKVMLPADFNDADVQHLENTRAPAETHAFDSEVLR